MITLASLMEPNELNKAAEDPTGRSIEIVHKLFIDVNIGDFVYLNSRDIFEVPYSDMLIQLLYKRFEIKVNAIKHKF